MAFGVTNNLRVPGIYKVLNVCNGKFYIGSSVNIESRIFKHLSALRRGIHNNAHLQAAFCLYGEDAFAFSLLESCESGSLLSREQHYIDTLKPAYNICSVAGNTLGVKHGPEAKAKMSAANMGNKRRLGKLHSAETKSLIGELAGRRKHTEETKAKVSASLMGNQRCLGRVPTAEHKALAAEQLQHQWDSGVRSREAAAERARLRWADPEWKAQQAAKIKAGKAARRAA